MLNFFFKKQDPESLAKRMHSRWWLEECWLSPPLATSSNLRWTNRRIREALWDARDQLENSTDPDLEPKLLKRIEYLESFKLDQWEVSNV